MLKIIEHQPGFSVTLPWKRLFWKFNYDRSLITSLVDNEDDQRWFQQTTHFLYFLVVFRHLHDKIESILLCWYHSTMTARFWPSIKEIWCWDKLIMSWLNYYLFDYYLVSISYIDGLAFSLVMVLSMSHHRSSQDISESLLQWGLAMAFPFISMHAIRPSTCSV